MSETAPPTATSPQSQLSFVGQLRQQYRAAMDAIDQLVPSLIGQGRELQALTVLHEKKNVVFELHRTLSVFYATILENKEVLRKFNSQRLAKLAGDPIPTWQILEKSSPGKKGWECIQATMDTFRRVNYVRQHWAFPEIITTETEYMLDVLEVLTEPDFQPTGQSA